MAPRPAMVLPLSRNRAKTGTRLDAVLRDVEADRDRRRIAPPDREVDVGHTRIERALVGIGNPLVRRDAAGWRKRHAAAAAAARADGTATGEHDHDADPLLEPGRL